MATPAGIEQCFGLFRLEVENFQAKATELLLLGLYERDANERTVRNEIIPNHSASMKKHRNIPPPAAVNPNGPPWRRIEVFVTPEEVHTFCDGLPMGDYAVADVQKRIARMWRSTHPAAFPVPSFPPRGGLGLYVDDGPAYFRNVVVEPLQQP